MSDKAKRDRTPEETNTEGNERQPAAEAREGMEPTGPETPGSDGDYEVVVRLLKENEELKDRALRLAADMENLRRRTARDVHDARTYAIANFARDMLSVSDNLLRAIEAVPAEAKEAGGAGLTSLLEGVEMTERAMLAALERHGVKRLAPEGEKFDPNFHQAMFEVERPDVPANTVVQVIQPGYSIGERVLRPAMVGIAKGGPKQAAANDSQPEPGPIDATAEKDA
jgi:molecular chaperone GrpE